MKNTHRYSISTIRVAAAAAVLIAAAALLAGCPSKGRAAYQNAMLHLQAQEYQPALDDFRKSLAAEPDNYMALFGEARALYELKQYQEALTAFEQFLTQTDSDHATYKSERDDAEFYRDKCKQQLGIEVPQNPADIPPPPMGE
jgi:tetratricopeptide (TPR) repeat protein